jgi:hypothetical protein
MEEKLIEHRYLKEILKRMNIALLQNLNSIIKTQGSPC